MPANARTELSSLAEWLPLTMCNAYSALGEPRPSYKQTNKLRQPNFVQNRTSGLATLSVKWPNFVQILSNFGQNLSVFHMNKSSDEIWLATLASENQQDFVQKPTVICPKNVNFGQNFVGYIGIQKTCKKHPDFIQKIQTYQCSHPKKSSDSFCPFYRWILSKFCLYFGQNLDVLPKCSQPLS